MKTLIKIIVGSILGLIYCNVLATTLAIQIDGVTGDPLNNVQKRLQVLQENDDGNVASHDIYYFYQQAPKNIKAAIMPYGYFKSKIRAQLLHTGNQWIAHFAVDPGPQLRITSVHVSVHGAGQNNAVINQYLQNFPLHPQQAFNNTDYNKAKLQLFELALQQGYLTAYFNLSQVLINVNHYTCQIILELNTGPRFYFGPVSFCQTPLSNHFLKRYVPFKTGEPFSSTQLLNLQNRLSSSNYFKNVTVNNDLNQVQNYHVPIFVDLTMQKMQQWLLGIGYGTDTGPRLSAQSNWRYVNAEGHQLNSQLTLSPVQSNLQASYIIPGPDPVSDQYSITASVTNNHLNQGDSTTELLGLNSIKAYNNQWTRTFSLNYQLEQFKFNQQPEQNSHLLIPGVSWVYLNSDNTVFPTKGNRFLISMQGSLQTGISDTTFFQTEIQDKYINHFTDNDRIILRTDLGYTAVHDINNFPLSLRFYAGGAQSVRGFSYQGLGPGRYLAVGSAEFQQRITDKWYGAFFYDAGNAMDAMNQPLARGAGIGVVWASPVGTMELSLAKALSLPGQPLRIQFTLGPDL
jgi:translocation and assembly module TamA